MKNDHDLLDTLHGLVGCEYMSDLKSDALRGRVLQVIGEMELSRFSPAEWEKAVSYLFQTDGKFNSLDDVRAFIAREERL